MSTFTVHILPLTSLGQYTAFPPSFIQQPFEVDYTAGDRQLQSSTSGASWLTGAFLVQLYYLYIML